MNETAQGLKIAILGGTGKEGKGLAYRWAKAGMTVHIGSRDKAKAQAAAAEVMGFMSGDAIVDGMSNLDAVQFSDIIILTVPYTAHRQTLESIKGQMAGKIFVDVTVPLVPPKVTVVQMPPEGSAAQEARRILGEDVPVCAAFQNISHENLMDDGKIECDVLVTGTSREARNQVITLVEAAGLNGWDAGPLENSVVVEGLTSILIGINKKYGSTHAGIKITGVKRPL